jgi:hypothetical protein
MVNLREGGIEVISRLQMKDLVQQAPSGIRAFTMIMDDFNKPSKETHQVIKTFMTIKVGYNKLLNGTRLGIRMFMIVMVGYNRL